MTVYDLENELAEVSMPDKRTMVTPSGFKLFSDPGDGEIEILATPNGSVFKFNAPMEFDDPEEPENGTKWHIYLPEIIDLPGVTGANENYPIKQFLKDFVVISARIMDENKPDWKPITVVFHNL